MNLENVMEHFLAASIVEMKDRLLDNFEISDGAKFFVELGDKAITAAGLGQEDWSI